MKFTNIRNIKFDQQSNNQVFPISFDCDYTDELSKEVKSATIEIPNAVVGVEFNGLDVFVFTAQALSTPSPEPSISDFFVKVTHNIITT